MPISVTGSNWSIMPVLFGSYARGDFNAWSDIDIVIIADKIPKSPLKRIEIIKECLIKYPDIEPIIISQEDYERLKRKKNPVATEINKNGIKIY